MWVTWNNVCDNGAFVSGETHTLKDTDGEKEWLETHFMKILCVPNRLPGFIDGVMITKGEKVVHHEDLFDC